MPDLLGKSPTKRARPNYLYAVISMALVLFLLGLFGLILLQATQIVNSFKERINVLIEIEPSTDSLSIASILQELNNADYSKKETIQFISKEEALLSLKTEFGQDFLNLDLPNPLYDVITFNLNAASVHSDLLSKLSNNFKAKDSVKDVHYQESMVHLIAENIKRISWLVLILGILFLVIAITLMHNTVRLSLYSNRFLIKNMELVGASWNFISRPFILKSIWYGILSGIIAITALVFVLLLAQNEFPFIKETPPVLQIVFIFLCLLIIGVIINGSSTWFVINKYLKMRLDDLY